jgi:hypothetical protein
VLGGEAEAIAVRFEEAHDPAAPIAEVLAAAVAALAGPDRTLRAEEVEAAVLDREGSRRAFRRLTDPEITAALPAVEANTAPGPEAAGTPSSEPDGDQP